MKREIAERWIAALRSGKFNQTTGVLHRTKEHGKDAEGYCCLGVLCELAVAEGVITSRVDSFGDLVAYGPSGHTGFLPEAVDAWAELTKGYDPVLSSGESLSVLNDDGKSFTEIADVIEADIDAL